jgi:hypothetical protein
VPTDLYDDRVRESSNGINRLESGDFIKKRCRNIGGALNRAGRISFLRWLIHGSANKEAGNGGFKKIHPARL